jgi:two-component system chemotaxis response regulator CheB
MMRGGGYELVVMAASAGGIQALGRVLGGLPATFPLPIAVVQHRSPQSPSVLDRVLQRGTRLRVKTAELGDSLQGGTVYVAPADQHLVIQADRTFGLSDGRRIRHVHSSANPLFESAAGVLGSRVIAVVLTGGGSDATDGVQAIKLRGGMVIAQDQATSQTFGMPGSAIATGAVDYILPLDQIAPALRAMVGDGAASKPVAAE